MIVYIIENTKNNKKYVGQTKNMKNRKILHKSKIGKTNLPLYNAMKKYGWRNFDFQIIYNSDDINDILEKETFFIKKYNTLHPNGYNMTIGGEGCCPSEETRKKMSISAKKWTNTKKHKKEFIKLMTSKEIILKRVETKKKNKSFDGKNNPRYIKINEEDFKNKYKSNMLIKDMAKYFNVGIGTIRRRIEKLNLSRKVPRNHQKYANVKKENNPRWNKNINDDIIWELYLKGNKPWTIGKKTGYPPTTIRRRIEYIKEVRK